METFLKNLPNIKDMVKSRYDSNKAIIEIISLVAEKFPDWRFHQILQNIEIIGRLGEDLFYEESIETLERILNNCLINSILQKEEFNKF